MATANPTLFTEQISGDEVAGQQDALGPGLQTKLNPVNGNVPCKVPTKPEGATVTVADVEPAPPLPEQVIR